jgi:hypothetical protein
MLLAGLAPLPDLRIPLRTCPNIQLPKGIRSKASGEIIQRTVSGILYHFREIGLLASLLVPRMFLSSSRRSTYFDGYRSGDDRGLPSLM